MDRFVNYEEFSVQNIVIGRISKVSDENIFINLKYMYPDGEISSITILTPMLFHWGIRDYNKDQRFMLTIPVYTRTPQTFVGVFNELDTYVKRYLQEHSQNIFGSILSEEDIDAMISRSILPIKNSSTKKLRFKMPVSHGKFKFSLFDESKKQIFPTENSGDNIENVLPKNSMVKFLFRIENIYIINQKIGYSKNLIQGMIKMFDRVSYLGECMFDAEEYADVDGDDASSHESAIDFGVEPSNILET